MSTLEKSGTPGPNAPLENPAELPAGRDLKAEKEKELALDRAKAASKSSRFEARRPPMMSSPLAEQPEYATLIYKTAANNPPARLQYPKVSTFVPNFQVVFYLLNYMDFLMSSTDKWTRNCAGWVSPISQLYIGVLCYIQVFRCMIASGIADVALVSWYEAFCRVYPLKDLWIPGPLVSAFRALSAFSPDENFRFGIVSPCLPRTPNWTRDRTYVLGDAFYKHLPNLQMFLDRYHKLCAVAQAANMNEATFFNHVDGPNSRHTIFGNDTRVIDNFWLASLAAPGAKFVTPGSLSLWQAAARFRNNIGLPAALDFGQNQQPVNDWSDVMLLTTSHQHFAQLASIMAKYSQFWNGSASLDSCSPTSSAAGAMKLRGVVPTSGNNLLGDMTATAEHGTHDSDDATDTNHKSFVGLWSNATLAFDSQCAVEDLPDLFIYAGGTWAFNCHLSPANEALNRAGPFWDLGPNVLEDKNVELVPGTLPTIMREYHNDTRIPSHKQ